MSTRSEKIAEALRETAAEFLAREAGRESMITVTNVAVSEDARRGIVFITVLPEAHEEAALAFANRNRGELVAVFRKHVKGVHLPYLEYRIDKGEKNRQRLDELSN
ncbi:MAG: ribosome-binding factor [Patescibacteria group bacterium]|jgi:ribosome-binding factor A|nr:ribosome-binding factor [Patescibacteria group bacterium]